MLSNIHALDRAFPQVRPQQATKRPKDMNENYHFGEYKTKLI